MTERFLPRAITLDLDDTLWSVGPAFEVFLEARQREALFDDVLPVLTPWSRRYRLVAVTVGNADVICVGLGGLHAADLYGPRVVAPFGACMPSTPRCATHARSACRRAADRAAPPYSSPRFASARWA
jgi:hypothetical protein